MTDITIINKEVKKMKDSKKPAGVGAPTSCKG